MRPCSRSSKAITEYADVTGETINGRHRLVLRGVVVAGRWWDAARPKTPAA
jgi:hypothetical protein